MSQGKPQTYANHTRFDPPFHFFIVPVLLITLIGAIVHLVKHPHLGSAWHVVLVITILLIAGKARSYALKAQDRVIRLEERMRLATLLPEPLRSRIGELDERQLIALRFASDGEIPALVQRTLSEKLTPKQIKQAIQIWRPDTFRV